VTDEELDHNAARRLAIIGHAEEVSGNVALTCRYCGISRTVFYTWCRRYQADGLAGRRDRWKRPLHSPNETPAEVVAKIIYLRTSYHFGPAKVCARWRMVYMTLRLLNRAPHLFLTRSVGLRTCMRLAF
jgi:transposase-like protein